MPPTAYDIGVLIGVLIGEGSFTWDGRQMEVTVRMHTRHEVLFRWIMSTFPGGKLYGPYHHDDRHYFQWMARGQFLKEVLIPLLDEYLLPVLDAHCHARYLAMKERGRAAAERSPS